jgi:tRNA A37 threonylcarbamoyltransferase TsaD
MATTVRDYIDKAKRVQSQIGNEIDDIARSFEDEILDLNREAMRELFASFG